ncbi:hypothetical protein [Mesorhizobium sp.]|nr:hypothetical protein [Mesorhizobium sp.]
MPLGKATTILPADSWAGQIAHVDACEGRYRLISIELAAGLLLAPRLEL